MKLFMEAKLSDLDNQKSKSYSFIATFQFSIILFSLILEYSSKVLKLTLSLVIILDESASLIVPLRGPLEASSVSTTLMRSGLYVFASSSSAYDFRFPDPMSSSSSGRRNRERNLPRPESSSSSSPPYERPKFVRLLLSSLL